MEHARIPNLQTIGFNTPAFRDKHLLGLTKDSQPNDPDQPDVAGHQIRDYQLIDVLGKGRMGIVYRVRHLRLQKDVALKLMSDYAFHSPAWLMSFEREMQVVGRLAGQYTTIANKTQYCANH